MSVVMVIPSIHEPSTRACLATLSPDLIDIAAIPGPPSGHQRDPHIVGVNGPTWTDGRPDLRLWVVWNTPTHNLGCAGSWNLAVEDVLRTGADWLWIVSAGVLFGKPGGADFVRWLGEFQTARPDVIAVEAGGDLGWHCIAFPRRTLEKIGTFDSIFEPAYFEDNDYSVRIQRAYGIDTKAPEFEGPMWPKVEIDAHLPEVAHGIIHSGVSVDFVELQHRFEEKWGSDESFRTPYNDPTLDWTHVGGPKVAA